MRSLLIRSLTGLVCLALAPHASFGQGNAYGKQKHEVQEQDDLASSQPLVKHVLT